MPGRASNPDLWPIAESPPKAGAKPKNGLVVCGTRAAVFCDKDAQVPARKSCKFPSTAATKLLVQAAMGSAMGLTFGLLLVVSNPAFAALIDTQGNSTIWVFVTTFTTMFAVGAALTGAVFMSNDNEL